MVERHGKVTGPRAPKVRNVTPRAIGDFPALPRSQLDAALRLSSPFMLGPPLCDELVALVQHMFTEEEAAVAARLGLYRSHTVSDVAVAIHRPAAEVAPILDRLAFEKRVIAAEGPAANRRYRLLPIMPGIFEMCLLRVSEDSITPWHRRFAELIDALFETGYLAEYLKASTPKAVRYIPLGIAIGAHPMALPTDKLEWVLDRFDDFAVGVCQCRLSEELVGRGCGRPKFNCTAMGAGARLAVAQGIMKSVSRREVVAIKREAEAHGLVNWMMNVESPHGFHCSCTCCGCCCKNFRIVSEFNAPSAMAPPHFTPAFDRAACTWCAKCALACPMAAITVDAAGKSIVWNAARCIGCGLCAVACDRAKAVAMAPAPEYREPFGNYLDFALRGAPRMIGTGLEIWARRRIDAFRGEG